MTELHVALLFHLLGAFSLVAGLTVAEVAFETARRRGTPGEVALLAGSGAAATHAPGCDLPMGWGVAPVGALLDAGVAVGLGTSGGGSNDAGHLLADARLAPYEG